MKRVPLDEESGECLFAIDVIDREMIVEVIAEALPSYKKKPRFFRLIHILESLSPRHPAVLKERARRSRD